MAILRIENFRNGAWMVRGEGPIPAGTPMDAIRANTDSSALNHVTRALLDGVVVYETKIRAKEVFGV